MVAALAGGSDAPALLLSDAMEEFTGFTIGFTPEGRRVWAERDEAIRYARKLGETFGMDAVTRLDVDLVVAAIAADQAEKAGQIVRD